jgi:hypothetical protein
MTLLDFVYLRTGVLGLLSMQTEAAREVFVIKNYWSPGLCTRSSWMGRCCLSISQPAPVCSVHPACRSYMPLYLLHVLQVRVPRLVTLPLYCPTYACLRATCVRDRVARCLGEQTDDRAAVVGDRRLGR